MVRCQVMKGQEVAGAGGGVGSHAGEPGRDHQQMPETSSRPVVVLTKMREACCGSMDWGLATRVPFVAWQPPKLRVLLDRFTKNTFAV